MVALTKTLIDSFVFAYPKNPNKADIRFDDKLVGFGVRVFPSGTKKFVIRYREKGSSKKWYYTIGTYGVLTLHQAREDAQKRLADLLKGINPQAQQRQEKKEITLGVFCVQYIERYAKPHKKSWRNDEQIIRDYINPRLGSKKLAAITRLDVTDLHQWIGLKLEKPTGANRVVEVLLKILSLAIEWGFLPENHVNPARRIKAFAEVKRDRFVTVEEMPKLMESIAQEENIYVRSLFILYPFLGMRRDELRLLRWDQISFEINQIKIPDTKNKTTLNLPLSSMVVTILKGLPRQVNNPYVFCGYHDGKALNGVNKIWTRIRRRAGLDDVRIHDLRHTAASWLAIGGESLLVIGKALNQLDQSSTRRYAHLSQDPVRDAMERLGERLSKYLDS